MPSTPDGDTRLRARGSEEAARSPSRPATRSASRAIARRIAVTVIGSTLLVLGVLLLVVPGPGVLVLMLALGVLAVEFAWARRWLRRVEAGASRLVRESSEDSRD